MVRAPKVAKSDRQITIHETQSDVASYTLTVLQ